MENQLSQLRQRIMEMKQSLFDEGVLDAEQITELDRLETDAADSNFVGEVLDLFLTDSTKYVTSITEILGKDPVDFAGMERLLFKILGSSSGAGAIKIKSKVRETIQYCEEKNLESIRKSFQQLKAEYDTFEAKVKPYVELLRQAKFIRVHGPRLPN